MQDEIILKLSLIIKDKLGFYYHENRLKELEQNLKSFIKEYNIKDLNSLFVKISKGTLKDDDLMALTRHLTVGETFFMRDIKAFEILQNIIIPEIVRDKKKALNKQIKILSAGCSTGEEAYSIAIVIDKLLGLLKDWDITIKAFDVNDNSLKRARTGLYKDWSFRGAPEWLKKEYFIEKKKNLYEISPRIRAMVDFYHFNLISEIERKNYTSPQYDVIFCRNVLMYFDEKIRNQVSSYINDLIVENGWLIVSPIEIQTFSKNELSPRNIDGFIVFKKQKNNFCKDTINVGNQLVEEEGKSPYKYDSNIEDIKLHAISKKFKTDLTKPETKIKKNKATQSIIETNNDVLVDKLLQDAQAKANTGLLEDALDILDKAVKLNKLNTKTYSLKAMVFEENGDLHAAEETLKKLLYIDNNSVVARFRLGHVLLKLNRKEDALKEFQNVIETLKAVKEESVMDELEMSAGRIIELSKSIIEEIAIK